MKWSWDVVWLGIILLLLGCGCSKAPLPTETEPDNVELEKGYSKILISSTDYQGQTVDSAEVYWDAELSGYTPFTKENVEAGIHSLRLQKQGFELYTESITVDQSQSVYVEALLKKMSLNKGQLFITVDRDSVVTVLSNEDDEIVDLFYDREKSYVLEPGGYFLKAERQGYRLFLSAVEIMTDSVVVQNIQMEKLQSIQLPDIVLAVADSGLVNQPVVVSWESNNAQRIDIDYIENPGLSGKREILFHSAGKRYIKATAYNNSGSMFVVDSVLISNPVENPLQPPTVKLNVDPERIKVNEAATIKWESSNATSVSVDYVPNAGFDGAWQVNFSQPGIYEIKAHAYGPGGTAVDVDTLIVEEADVPIVKPPVIVNFSVTPDSIEKGATATLKWEVSGENVKILIDQGIGEVGKIGNKNVKPDVNTTYTISVSNNGGTVHESVTLKVSDKIDPTVNPPSIIKFTVAPDSIQKGETAVLQWEVTGQNIKVMLDQAIGEVGKIGNQNVKPDVTTSYTLSASNDGGTEFKTVTLKVEKKDDPIMNPPVINTFSISPDSIELGETAVLHWEISGENVKATLDQSIGEVGLIGNQNVTPVISTTYTLSASNEAGITTETIILGVREFDIPIVKFPVLDFKVNPDVVNFGEPVSISWNSDGYQVIIDQGIGVRGPSGTEDVYFENPGLKIFTAVAYNENQTLTTKYDSVLVNEPEQPELPIIYLAVDDSSEVGKPLLIEWHSLYAERVDVDYVPKSGVNGKSEVIFDSEGTRVISATAFNLAGQVTATKTIEVVSIEILPQPAPIFIRSNAKVAVSHTEIPPVNYNAGAGEIIREGWYQVSSNVWYASGDDQVNESFFLVLKDDSDNYFYPRNANAGMYKVVPDDPGAPHVTERQTGKFYLKPGRVTVELHHYATISRDFPQYMNGNAFTGPESVQITSIILEYIQP
jgi:hypothetical protein